MSIDVDARAKSLVDDLAFRSGGITNAELFRKCLALYNAVLTHNEHGGTLIFKHADGKEERLFIL